MKKLFSLFNTTALLLLIIVSSGCLKDRFTKTYTLMYPVYKERSEVLANIKSNDPQTIGSPGKIYLYGKYIFLNEINKGVHIIDNSNPSDPKQVSFIDIPGNVDIAVKGNILYADFYSDLLAIDVSNPLDAKMVKLLPGIFPERMYEGGFVPQSDMVIVDWLKKDTTVEVSRSDRNNGGGWSCVNCLFSAIAADASLNSSNKSASVPGLGGSMARFAVVNNYMYTVDMHSLKVISISNAADPIVETTMNAGWDIETIYPFKDKLFIGSMSGMFIFSISNPAVPVSEGAFIHARACDPVIADDNHAFITLREGTSCGPAKDELLVVDVQNINAPSLIKAYDMSNPHGLSKDGSLLFVCDGIDGLKIYDASDVEQLKLKKHIRDKETYDVIAWNKKLVLVTQEGIEQYDYTDAENIRLLSIIRVIK